ncbi:MAG: Gfo/Idh/MocA family oxidoreductase [Bryobacteraceae bacterium]
MTRRTVLAALTAAAAAPAQPERIRVALIGGGHSHAFAKAKILRDSTDWELAGIAEDDARILEKYTAIGIGKLSVQGVLGDSSVKVVAVESAVRDHQKHARMALEAGKHVHVEKPPADTMNGMRQLIHLAKEKNLLLQSGYMWRYHPGMNAVLEAARQGWLGDVYLVRGQINTLIEPRRRPEWSEFAGGHMFELCSHLIDATTRLLGRPVKVTPFLRHDASLTDNLKDNTVAVFEYPKAMAIIHGATMQPGSGGHRMFEVQGTNGTATVRPIEPPGVTIELANAAGPYSKGKQRLPMAEYKRYAGDLAELAAAVRGQKKLSVSLEEEMLVGETVLRASGMA